MRVEAGVLVVEGELAGEVEARLIARHRGDGAEVAVPAELRGGRFAARLELAPLARGGVWDLWLGDRRVGTHLDGLPGKKDIAIFPAHRAGGLELRPYYTVEDNVSIRVAEPHAEPAAAPVVPGAESRRRRLLGRPRRRRAPRRTRAGLRVAAPTRRHRPAARQDPGAARLRPRRHRADQPQPRRGARRRPRGRADQPDTAPPRAVLRASRTASPSRSSTTSAGAAGCSPASRAC